MKTLSIIIPAYNEETHIVNTLNDLLRGEKENPFSLIEVVVIDDGSSDDTRKIVDEYSLRDDRVRCEGYEKNHGKGHAVSFGMKKTSGDYKIFLDADGSTHIDSVNKILNHANDQDLDIIIGSRSKSSGGIIDVPQSKKRAKLGGLGSNLIKVFLKMPIRDTQCGCKIFKKDIADDLFSNMRSKGWMFDCDLLYRAHKKGINIKEVGVNWSNKKVSKVKAISYPKSFIDLIKIRFYYNTLD